MQVCVLGSYGEEERLKASVRGLRMHFDGFSFGSIQSDGTVYEHDVIIDRGEIRKRKKKRSKKFREQFGHTPLSIEEEIPWQCHQLIIGSGAYGRLPVMQGVQREAERHKVKLLVLPTSDAIEVLKREPKDTNAILKSRASTPPSSVGRTISVVIDTAKEAA